jgi:plastocyanin
MPVAVYNGTDVGGKDAQASDIPQDEVLTHTHLAENDNHGGTPAGAPDPLALPSVAVPNGTVNIQQFAYQGVQGAGPSVPTIEPGQALTFKNLDAVPNTNAFHTITACKDPCTATTGVAYPIANGPVTFDSGELGYNGNYGSFNGAPAAGRDTWQTPKDLPTGTYTYFCRIHPFMRGSFRVEPQGSPRQTLRAQKKQKLSKAAVTETVDKSATVRLQARVKGGKAGASAATRALSQALDAKRSTISVNRGVTTKIKLRFSKKARKRLRAALGRSGAQKIIVTATATDGFGKTSTAKAKFRLIG